MKIIIEIAHPGNVHYFKYIINELKKKKHKILVVSRNRGPTIKLLNFYGINHIPISKAKKGFMGMVYEIIERDWNLYKIAKQFRPDLLVGRSISFAHVSRLIGAKAILDDDDGKAAGVIRHIIYPFVDTICTPSCLSDNLGEKQIRYNGYKELAYLHPNWFKPNLNVLEKFNLPQNATYFVLRFVSFKASHDFNKKGLSIETKYKIIKKLERYGKIFISSESELPPEFKKYQISIPPYLFHDLLYFSTLYIGDSQTVTTESAVLGVPTLHSNSFYNKIDNFKELANKYKLMFSYPISEQDKLIKKIDELLKIKNLKQIWHKKRDKMLKDKIDVTKFMVDFIDRYPQSFYELKNKK